MKQRYRRGFSAVEKAELWDRWQRGESLNAIGRAFGKPSSSIYFQLAPHGGIRPAPRRRSRLALTLSEREEISSRHCGSTIDPIDGEITGPLGLDGEPGSPPSMGAMISIERPWRIRGPGTGPCGRSAVGWQLIRSYAGRWRESSG